MRSSIALSLALGLTATPCGAIAAPSWFPISDSAHDDYVVAAISDGARGALIAWFTQLGPSESDIYIQRAPGDGRPPPGWPLSGLAVCTAPGEQYVSAMIPDGEGGAFVAWTDDRDGADEIYLHHVLHDGNVDPGWPVDGLRITPATASTRSAPRIAGDGAGGAYVAWSEDRFGPTGIDVFMQRVTQAGSVAAGWPAGGMVVCGAPEAQYVAAVASGDAGAYVVWLDHRDGVEGAAYVQLVLPDGSFPLAWVVGGTPLGIGPAAQSEVEAIVMPDGGVLAVWRDLRDEPIHGDLYGGRVLAPGGRAPGWPGSGRKLVSAPGIDWQAQLVPDDAGGAFLAWTDGRAGEEFDADIYALRVTAAGDPAPGWPANGVPVCAEPHDQREPRIVGDGSGGLFVFWLDARAGTPGDYDVYVRRMGRDGALATGWNAHGNPLTYRATGVILGGAVANGRDGALITWSEEADASTSLDVLAEWVGPGPPPPTVITTATPTLYLSAYPTPATGSVRLHLSMQGGGIVEVWVHDLSGRRVRVIEDGVRFNGVYETAWDGRDDDGRQMPPGVYIARARVRDPWQVASTRVVWLGR